MYLETKSLTKVFGKQTAVDNLDLAIEKGSFTAILGPNGAGKSTTIEMLLGALSPTSGSIYYQTKKPQFGVVFQESVLDAELTVRENLQIRQKMAGTNEPETITKVITQLGLSEFANKRYGRLSGGQRRRADIARALLVQPEILFLDEPTAGLDIQTRKTIWQALTELRQQEDLTIVLTTHYLEEADQADMVFIIDHGKLIARGSADDLKHRYAKNQLLLQTEQLDKLKKHLIQFEYLVVGADKVQITPADTRAALQILDQVGPLLTHFEYREGTIDDAFIALTGKEMH